MFFKAIVRNERYGLERERRERESVMFFLSFFFPFSVIM